MLRFFSATRLFCASFIASAAADEMLRGSRASPPGAGPRANRSMPGNATSAFMTDAPDASVAIVASKKAGLQGNEMIPGNATGAFLAADDVGATMDIQAAAIQAAAKKPGVERSWPSVIPWSTSDQSLVPLIQGSLNTLQSKTNLRFVPRQAEADYLNFKLAAKGNSECSGQSGYGYKGGAHDVEIATQQACFNRWDKVQALVMHEVLHAMGFRHEHTRPDRDHHVVVHIGNAGPPEKLHNFDIRARHGSDWIPYDIESIMHYDSKAWSINGRKTLTRRHDREYWSGKCFLCPADRYKPSDCNFVRERPCGFFMCEALCKTDELDNPLHVTALDAQKVNYMYRSMSRDYEGRLGYCTPWGNDGGDLCRQQPSLQVCQNVDSKFYLRDCLGDYECVAQLCSANAQHCVGYTRRVSDGAFKLKSVASSTGGSASEYNCFTRRVPKLFLKRATPGWCFPWSGHGGDLCREHPQLPVCKGVDSLFYLPDCKRNEPCVKARCVQEPRCVGFTVREHDGAYKLKSRVDGHHPHGGYGCYSFPDRRQ